MTDGTTSIGAPLGRRDLLKLLGGAIALAGLDGCERLPDEDALPYAEMPEGETTGIARYYATIVEHDGIAQPAIGKTIDGRPIKLEGNPAHPASRGASDAFTQAALLGLYDPERSKQPARNAFPSGWHEWDGAIADLRQRNDKTAGSGFALLTGPVGSPALLRQIQGIMDRWPATRWYEHRPLPDMGRNRLALEQAHAVVAFDHDLLGPGPLQIFHATGWGARRRAFQAGDGSALLFVAEPSPTVTGVTAQDRLPAREDRMGPLLAALAARIGMPVPVPTLSTPEAGWIERAAGALMAEPGRGLVTVGPHHPPQFAALAFAIDRHLGNLGETRFALQPAPGASSSLAELTTAAQAGRIDTLFVLDANPAYASTDGAGFAAALGHIRESFHAGLHADETAALCDWHAPLAHGLESWSDGETADGTVLIGQPLVRPWLPVRSRHRLLADLIGRDGTDRELLRAGWPDLTDEAWEAALLGRPVGPAPAREKPAAPRSTGPAGEPQGDLCVIVRPDPAVWDGQFASNPWLQELPRPLTKIAWQNAVHISPALARERGLSAGDMVRLSVGRARIEGPVWILPGQERRTILLHLGGGRRAGGSVAEGAGFDAWPLAAANGPVSLVSLGRNEPVCTTQHHFAMEGEEFVRFVDGLGDRLPPEPPKANFYPRQLSRPAWGMAIDLDLCIGCNACVVACVAENNIPMVGREEVAKGREMHWIRVDRYAEGDPENPVHVFQPVPCMHCEDAPCEMGCPVNATVHSPDGLNLQVYNRCIGTRTCSAYCPYKVRRFNWFDLTGKDPPELKAVRNPDVTVRGRGVMEKCTYCIQRISGARRQAKREGRPIADGEVVTACQAACPTDAIAFGDTSDPATAVSQRKASGRDYDLLPDANTRPRTTYGARIRSGEA
ncbi:MAG: 4Fe-4S dicluster domain-containing protein [Novosphingobium sp.]|nr:4Fe-4S dicluster domain-containing protein [Novosphingobium sp.]